MILNTVILVAGTLAISVPVGIVLAVLLVRTDLPGRRALMFLLTMLLVVPLYLQTGAWQAGFGLQGWYSALSGQPELIDGMRGAIWVHAAASVAWVALIVGVGLRLAEPELEEEALLYASPGVVLFRVTLRRAAGAVGVAVLWVTVCAAGEMTVTDLFRVRTFAEEIYAANAGTGDLQASAVELLPSIAITAALVMCGLVLSARLMARHRPLGFRFRRGFALGRWRWPAAGLAWTFAAILLGVPLINLMYQAGLQAMTHTGEATEIQWRADKLLDMVFVKSLEQFGDEIRTSLIVAGLAASTTLLAALVLAWKACSGRWPAVLVCMIVALLLATPGPLLGVAVIYLLGPFRAVYDSLAAPTLAICLRALPVATLIMWHALRTVPDDLLDTARLHGAGPWARLLLVSVPARWPAVVIAFLVVFVIALGDLAASQLVPVPGHQTIANRVFDRLHSGAQDQVCGLFLAMLLFLAAVTVLIVLLWRRWQTRLAAPDKSA